MGPPPFALARLSCSELFADLLQRKQRSDSLSPGVQTPHLGVARGVPANRTQKDEGTLPSRGGSWWGPAEVTLRQELRGSTESLKIAPLSRLLAAACMWFKGLASVKIQILPRRVLVLLSIYSHPGCGRIVHPKEL